MTRSATKMKDNSGRKESLEGNRRSCLKQAVKVRCFSLRVLVAQWLAYVFAGIPHLLFHQAKMLPHIISVLLVVIVIFPSSVAVSCVCLSQTVGPCDCKYTVVICILLCYTWF